MVAATHIWGNTADIAAPQENDGFDAEQRGENVIQAGDFCIDVTARCATVRGHRLQLSGPEFDVLVFLTSHRRHLVTSHTRLASRAVAGNKVRQADFLPNLFSLRKKLQEAVPGVSYIDTEVWVLFDFHPDAHGR